MSISKWFQEESNFKLIAAAVVICGILYAALYNPYDDDYLAEVEEELKLSRVICERSTNWVLNHTARLKLNNHVLEQLDVDGKKIKLEHVKYPQAVLLHDGFGHPNAQVELYCTFEDPRGNTGKSYYFDYRQRQWIDKTISRR